MISYDEGFKKIKFIVEYKDKRQVNKGITLE